MAHNWTQKSFFEMREVEISLLWDEIQSTNFMEIVCSYIILYPVDVIYNSGLTFNPKGQKFCLNSNCKINNI